MASVELYSGIEPQVVLCQEGATAGSFKRGDLVYTNSAGQVILATTNKIFGIAKADAQAVQGTLLGVDLVNENDIYSMRYEGTTDQNLVGAYNDVTFTAGAHVVATTQGSAKDVFIVGLDPRDPYATAGGRLLVRFNMKAFEPR